MEPFKEQSALFGFREVTVGPEGGDVFGLAGSGWTVNPLQSGLGFAPAAIFFERVEEILA